MNTKLVLAACLLSTSTVLGTLQANTVPLGTKSSTSTQPINPPIVPPPLSPANGTAPIQPILPPINPPPLNPPINPLNPPINPPPLNPPINPPPLNPNGTTHINPPPLYPNGTTPINPPPLFPNGTTPINPPPLPPVTPKYAGHGFHVFVDLNFDATLRGNTELIGVHLHTGSSTTNGPVNVVLCGSAPLPSINGPCRVTNPESTNQGRFKAEFSSHSSVGAWTNGINNATAVPGATTLANGAATTYQTFLEALNSATPRNSLVYLNFHTRYSLRHNEGKAFGLARAQLRPVACPSKMHVPKHARCFASIGQISSYQTNQVHGLPRQFPPKAGQAKPTRQIRNELSKVLVVFVDPNHA